MFLKPREDAAVSEISVVLKEWKPLWHQLFTVSQETRTNADVANYLFYGCDNMRDFALFVVDDVSW